MSTLRKYKGPLKFKNKFVFFNNFKRAHEGSSLLPSNFPFYFDRGPSYAEATLPSWDKVGVCVFLFAVLQTKGAGAFPALIKQDQVHWNYFSPFFKGVFHQNMSCVCVYVYIYIYTQKHLFTYIFIYIIYLYIHTYT